MTDQKNLEILADRIKCFRQQTWGPEAIARIAQYGKREGLDILSMLTGPSGELLDFETLEQKAEAVAWAMAHVAVEDSKDLAHVAEIRHENPSDTQPESDSQRLYLLKGLAEFYVSLQETRALKAVSELSRDV